MPQPEVIYWDKDGTLVDENYVAYADVANILKLQQDKERLNIVATRAGKVKTDAQLVSNESGLDSCYIWIQ